MSSEKKISIYLRNKDITPSSYYRIYQYTKSFDGIVTIREIAPKKIYETHLNISSNYGKKKIVVGTIYYLVMLTRVMFYLFLDLIKKPEYIIVSKTFCPKYTPWLLRFLIKKMSANSILIWDFDDNILESKEISKKQFEILEEKSHYIIVTNDFLKNKITPEFHDKVLFLPTTDGDFQQFNEKELLKKRAADFNKEIRIVWVATAGNIPNLLNVITSLDEAAYLLTEKLNKKLTLIVVCNKAVKVDVKYLTLINIKWSREKAKHEIFNAHIGIMPLILNEYSLGKGGFKLVQYLSTGLPVIASRVGFNEEVVSSECGILVSDNKTTDGWVDAVIELSESPEKWVEYSIAAYDRWKEKFSYDYNLKVWNDLLKSRIK